MLLHAPEQALRRLRPGKTYADGHGRRKKFMGNSGRWPFPLTPARRRLAGRRRTIEIVVEIVSVKCPPWMPLHDDLIGHCMMGAMRAAGTYKRDKGAKWKTWLSFIVRNEINGYFRTRYYAESGFHRSDSDDTEPEEYTPALDQIAIYVHPYEGGEEWDGSYD